MYFAKFQKFCRNFSGNFETKINMKDKFQNSYSIRPTEIIICDHFSGNSVLFLAM